MTAIAAAHATAADQAEALKAALCIGRPDAAEELSPYAACLMPLLEALRWRGTPRQISEALPHFVSNLDLTNLRNVLVNLGYRTSPLPTRLDDLDRRFLPCLFVAHNDDVYVASDRQDGGIELFDGKTQTRFPATSAVGGGVAYIVDTIDPASLKTERGEGEWFRNMTRRFRGVVVQLLALTFVTNLLALAIPLFVMAVYDRVIGQHSPGTLIYLVVGLLAALAWEFALRMLRARAMAYVGARMDFLASVAAFKQILHLPPALTEGAPIGTQVSRLREFESLREFFTSPLGMVLLDLPFALIFVVVIGIIAGPLALIPLAMLVVFVVAGLVVFPRLRMRSRAASSARAERHGFIVEMLSKMRDIKQLNAEDVWYQRFRTLSADAAVSDFRARLMSSFLQTFGHVVMMAAGIATLAGGAVLVLEGSVTTGGLVATMALVWRVLAPLSVLFSTAMRFENIKGAIRQLNQLMQFQPEREPDVLPVQKRVFRGGVSFSRVSLRYATNAEPALLGVSFDIEPGEVVAIVGPTGSGKSSLIKLVAGLYTPQAGTVAIDGLDLRQLDPIELRHSISYAPQYNHHFYGTIAQNFRLVDPTATDEDLREAARLALIEDEILSLPQGFDTRIGDHSFNQLPSGFHQRLSLARAYLRKAPIMLFDEPGTTLDERGDTAFMNAIRAFSGSSTILMVTHRPSHMKLADKIFFLREGRLELAGPTKEVLPRLARDQL